MYVHITSAGVRGWGSSGKHAGWPWASRPPVRKAQACKRQPAKLPVRLKHPSPSHMVFGVTRNMNVKANFRLLPLHTTRHSHATHGLSTRRPKTPACKNLNRNKWKLAVEREHMTRACSKHLSNQKISKSCQQDWKTKQINTHHKAKTAHESKPETEVKPSSCFLRRNGAQVVLLEVCSFTRTDKCYGARFKYQQPVWRHDARGLLSQSSSVSRNARQWNRLCAGLQRDKEGPIQMRTISSRCSMLWINHVLWNVLTL